jgi:hypothetical protein
MGHQIQKGTFMTQRLKFALLTLLVGGATWLAPPATADEWNEETVLTFNEAVEIPGQVLPAGTYVFRVADSQSDRDIVQISTEDQKHVLATVLAIPDYRAEPTDKTVVTFEERRSGSPEALRSWFYPGDIYGVQFVYPKSTQQYAAQSEQPTSPAAPQQATAEQSRSTPQAAVIIREEEVIIAQLTPPPAADNAPATENESTPTTVPNTLPQTAGNFASVPLLGIVLLSGGWTAIRFATRKS